MQKPQFFITPPKEGHKQEYTMDTCGYTPGCTQTRQPSPDNAINYKAKTFKIMKELAEAEVAVISSRSATKRTAILSGTSRHSLKGIDRKNRGY